MMKLALYMGVGGATLCLTACVVAMINHPETGWWPYCTALWAVASIWNHCVAFRWFMLADRAKRAAERAAETVIALLREREALVLEATELLKERNQEK